VSLGTKKALGVVLEPNVAAHFAWGMSSKMCEH